MCGGESRKEGVRCGGKQENKDGRGLWLLALAPWKLLGLGE